MPADSTPFDDEDLYSPSLDESYDLAPMGFPWNPWSLVLWLFFVGSFAGGALLGLNYRRLGKPQLGTRCFIGFGVGATLALCVGMWLVAGRAGEELTVSARQVRRSMQFLSLIPGVAIAYHQQKWFRAYDMGDGEHGKFRSQAMVALGGFLVNVVIVLALQSIFRVPS